MRKIHVEIDTGFVNCTHEVDIEVEDDATEEEIDEYARDLVWEYICPYWKEIP